MEKQTNIEKKKENNIFFKEPNINHNSYNIIKDVNQLNKEIEIIIKSNKNNRKCL